MFNRLVALFLLTSIMIVTLSCSDNTKTSTPSMDLLTAIDKENIEIVQQHIDMGTNINNYPIPEGIPLAGAHPLHLAVVKGNAEIVDLLLSNGADINLEANNRDKATPLHWAVFFLQKEMVDLLIDSGAEINFVDANGTTPLDTANYTKVINIKDEKKLSIINEIMIVLSEKDALSASDL